MNTSIEVRLDAIGTGDLEFLRLLRNQERRWFFDQREITPEAQAAWHRQLGQHPRDHWYLVRANEAPAGCFAIKVGDGDGRAEVRCILLSPAFRGQGVMTRAIAAAMEQLGPLRYFAEVLPDNDQSLGLFSRLGFATRYVTVERTAP